MKINEMLGIGGKWNNDITGRSSFNETYLVESPENHLFESWPGIKNIIEDYLEYYESKVVNIKPNFHKLELTDQIYYWITNEKKIILGISLEKRPYALVVRMSGKDPAFRKRPPFASDVYLNILKDSKKDICLHSDETLSEDGFKIWKKLFNSGHKVCLYAKDKPTQTLEKFSSLEEMEKYFKKDKSYRNYSYVLCESQFGFGNVMGHFATRKIREDNNLGVIN